MTGDLLMPAFSSDMETGFVARWLKRPGDLLRAGDLLVEVENDKATMELEAPRDGVLLEILVEAGPTRIPVHAPIARIGPVDPAALAGAGPAARPAPALSIPRLDLDAALADALADAMRRDPRIVVYGAGVGQGRIAAFAREFGHERAPELPLCEEAILGLAIGAARGGLRPVVDLPGFALAGRALGALLLACERAREEPMALVLRIGRGRAQARDGGFAADASAVLAAFPGLDVAIPSTVEDAAAALRMALCGVRPTALLEPRVPEALPPYSDLAPPGEGRLAVRRRAGDDIAIVAFGEALAPALAAADELAAEGVGAEVWDPRWLRPLDLESLAAAARRCGRLLIVEPWRGPVGAEILAALAEAGVALERAPRRLDLSAADGEPAAEVARAARKILSAPPA